MRFWDLRTRQQTRVLETPAKGPVSALLTLERPRAMQVLGTRGRQQSGKGAARAQPLATLAKFSGAQGALRPWEDALVLVDGSGMEEFDEASARLAGEASAGLATRTPADGAGAAEEGGEAGPSGEAAALAALTEENAGLKQQLERAAAAIERLMALQGAPAERPRGKV